MKPIIENDKDQRVYNWLCEKVGEEAIINASKKLIGKRKPYLSNILKELNLTIPFEVKNSKEVGLKKLAEINQILNKAKKL